MKISGTQIISHKADRNSKVLTLAAVGNEISDQHIREASARLPLYGLGSYKLNVIQGNISDSLLSLKGEITNMNNTKEELKETINHQSVEISELRKKLSGYTRYETLTKQIVGELQSFYPQIEYLSLSESIESGKDTNSINTFVTAQVRLNSQNDKLNETDRAKISAYIKSRVQADSVVLVLR